ncbi:MAG: hypothetical protein S4CHLAM20_15240 [Chlamydiia bacterium]|nr:hypothetical protein [Chlamydiia bacterium]
MTFILLSVFFYFIIGVLAGVTGALLGIGGGAITVPALFFVFTILGFPKDSIMHIAIGTSLSSMAINTLAATYFHNKKKSVVWLAVGRMLIGIIIGTILGSLVARELSTSLLKIIFGVFACLLGLTLIKPIKEITEAKSIPSFLTFTIIGLGVAFLANILGLGGGFFMVPIFFLFHFHGRKAIGTSSATSFLISLGGTIGYLFSAKESLNMPGCIGYIYIPAFVIIGLTSLVFSSLGVKLAHSLPINFIRKIFAVVIILVGLAMIFN